MSERRLTRFEAQVERLFLIARAVVEGLFAGRNVAAMVARTADVVRQLFPARLPKKPAPLREQLRDRLGRERVPGQVEEARFTARADERARRVRSLRELERVESRDVD